MSVDRAVLVSFLNELLNISGIADSSCNGLQVQGEAIVKKIGLSVDACLNVYQKAKSLGCQMALVHHGIIWGGLQSITGSIRNQLDFLLRNDLSLYAAHLPLDLHPILGNNIVLAKALDLMDIQSFGHYKGVSIGFKGIAPRPMTAQEICGILRAKGLCGNFSALPFGPNTNRSVGIVSGGGSDALPEAIDNCLDCFVTGEPFHWNHHMALEGRINVAYCGHYHTEKGGVMALGEHIKSAFDVETVFIEEPTLV
jgi:dinuclear metal center YbgI/SA1388 family protein